MEDNLRKLHPDDLNVTHSCAYNWLRKCARLYNVKVRDAYEHNETKEIVGNIYEVLDVLEDGKKVIINKADCFRFSIRVVDDLPEIFVYFSRSNKPYRVYHEFHFDTEPVFPLGKLLRAKSPKEADTLAWVDSMKPVMFPFAFHVAFLKQEIAEGGKPEHIQAVKAMLKPYIDAMREDMASRAETKASKKK